MSKTAANSKSKEMCFEFHCGLEKDSLHVIPQKLKIIDYNNQVYLCFQ